MQHHRCYGVQDNGLSHSQGKVRAVNFEMLDESSRSLEAADSPSTQMHCESHASPLVLAGQMLASWH